MDNLTDRPEAKYTMLFQPSTSWEIFVPIIEVVKTPT